MILILPTFEYFKAKFWEPVYKPSLTWTVKSTVVAVPTSKACFKVKNGFNSLPSPVVSLPSRDTQNSAGEWSKLTVAVPFETITPNGLGLVS